MTPAAIVFDLYGTLLRIDALSERVRAAGIAEPAAFVAAWRTKQIEYAWCATLMDEYRHFDALTQRALAYTCASFGTDLDDEARAYLAAGWLELDPHPDVPPALAALRAHGIPLAVLTNGVRASAERALRAGGIREEIDDLLSVESVRTYKPDPRVYRLATARYACEPERILFVSSNGWDASGAAAFGFRVAWCNRAGLPAEMMGYSPTFTIANLGELQALVS